MKAVGLLGIAFSLFIFASEASAQTPSRVGSFRDWSSFTYTGQNGKVCFAATQPTESQPRTGADGQPIRRDAIYFMITTIPAEGRREEPSVRIGYPFQIGSRPTIDIDGTQFTLIVDADTAWVENRADEPTLVSAMRAGQRMVVRGTSQRGTNTVDTFSLLGVSAALDSVNTECPADPA